VTWLLFNSYIDSLLLLKKLSYLVVAWLFALYCWSRAVLCCSWSLESCMLLFIVMFTVVVLWVLDVLEAKL